MSLATGMTLMGRKQAELLMESTCVITRAYVGEPIINTSTGANETPAATSIYAGKCRLRFPNPSVDGAVSAGQQVAEQSAILSLPVLAAGSADVRTDDVATVTSPLDPTNRIVRIAGVHSQTHSTARRFPVEITS